MTTGAPVSASITRGPEGFAGEAGERVTRKAVGRVAGPECTTRSCRIDKSRGGHAGCPSQAR